VTRRSLARSVPWLGTSSLQDVALAIGLLPLWWVFGLEQVLYPVLLLPPLVKVLVARRSIVVTEVLVALTVFLVAYLLSALWIVEQERYLTYLRNLSTYLFGAQLLIILPGAVRSPADVRTVLRGVALAMASAALLGLLAIVGLEVGRRSVPSLVAPLLPASIADTAFGGAIAERSTGWVSWFGGVSYFRVSSLFLWPTTYAPALAMTLALGSVAVGIASRRLRRLVALPFMALLAVNLAFTTGRVAMLGLAAAAVYWFVADWSRGRPFRLLTGSTSLLLVGAAALLTVADPVGLAEDAFFARGTGSPTSRAVIYHQTLAGFLERPLFGWGTERNIAGVASTFIYPAGSHSTYLGTLYRQGIVGLMALLLLLVAMWRATGRPRRVDATDRDAAFLLDVLLGARLALIVALVAGVTVALDLDSSVMMLLWIIIALACAARRIVTHPARRPA
jgi:O-antigen ligase